MGYQYWKIILTPTHESPSLVWQTDNMSFGYIILPEVMRKWKLRALDLSWFKILADFKILAFQNPEFKILADFKILAFQNPEFKVLGDFKKQATLKG